MAKKQLDERLTFTFLWRIENFSFWNPECHGKNILSPQFRALSLGNSDWLLRFFPKGLSEDDEDICFQLVSSNTEISVDSEVSFIDGSGSVLISGTLKNQKLRAGLPVDLFSCRTQQEVLVDQKSSFLQQDTLTIRCRLWNSNKSLELAEHCSARTRIEVQETSLLCPFDVFSQFELGHMETIPVALNASSELSLLRMNFTLKGASVKDSCVHCEIVSSKIKNPLSITGKISVLNNRQKVFKSVEDKHTYSTSPKQQTWNFPTLVSRDELLERRFECLCNDVLTLLCEYTANTGKIYETIEKNCYGPDNLIDIPSQNSHNQLLNLDKFQENNDSVAKMQEDFLTMYKEQSLSDFQLSSGDVSFSVHKNVLSARSPVFKLLFSSDMKEAQTSSLDVPDVDAVTLNRLLTFLYTGTVDDLLWESASKLYYAADKYQVSTLKEECSFVLRSDISVSNVCNILALADRHQDDGLTAFVQDFILDNYDDIVLSDEWGRFLDNESRLAGKTMQKVYKKKVIDGQTHDLASH